jgi:hypothetical protein
MKKKCATGSCKNKRLADRLICAACQSRKLKKENPFLYFFNALRNNAKRRGIAFSLSLTQFKNFAIETEYIIKKGQSSKSLTIDRVRPEEGYHIDNIQVLTNRSNVIKHRLSYDHDKRGLRFKKIADWSNAPLLPFLIVRFKIKFN